MGLAAQVAKETLSLTNLTVLLLIERSVVPCGIFVLMCLHASFEHRMMTHFLCTLRLDLFIFTFRDFLHIRFSKSNVAYGAPGSVRVFPTITLPSLAALSLVKWLVVLSLIESLVVIKCEEFVNILRKTVEQKCITTNEYVDVSRSKAFVQFGTVCIYDT